MMKQLLPFTLILLILTACTPSRKAAVDAYSGATTTKTQGGNSLFHNENPVKLQKSKLIVTGEIQQLTEVNFSKLPIREVFVKESLLNMANEPEFSGAYRYSGYSLFDILNQIKPVKKNAGIFRPEIDLFIKIENSKGEFVVFSWSEIFFTVIPHQVIIATQAAQIKPHKKEVNYPTPSSWKIVAANDLYAFRNLQDPVKITILSFDKKQYTIKRGLHEIYSPSLQVTGDNHDLWKPITGFTVQQPVPAEKQVTYNTTFYGMGMGYHPAPAFTGIMLHNVMHDSFNAFDPMMNMKGLVCFASADGYRAVFSFSELFNRTDQVKPLLAITEDQADGGYFRVFLPTDFYADRSVKALSEIYFFTGD